MKKCFYYIILLAAFILIACSASHTPHSAAKHFYSSIAEGEYDEALAITTLKDDADPEIYYAIMEKVSRSIAERRGACGDCEGAHGRGSGNGCGYGADTLCQRRTAGGDVRRCEGRGRVAYRC